MNFRKFSTNSTLYLFNFYSFSFFNSIPFHFSTIQQFLCHETRMPDSRLDSSLMNFYFQLTLFQICKVFFDSRFSIFYSPFWILVSRFLILKFLSLDSQFSILDTRLATLDSQLSTLENFYFQFILFNSNVNFSLSLLFGFRFSILYFPLSILDSLFSIIDCPFSFLD